MQKEIIERFVGAWNNEDNSERHRLLQLSFDDNGSYSDDFVTKKLTSLNELHFFINKFRISISNSITLKGEPKFHQDCFRFNLEIKKVSNEVVNSTFFGEIEKNKIKSIIGFIDD
ncbi:MAG: hypothetical protein HND52_10120 [Ignavibacteriae bacterium]|nr:hypothetical protein [Ignavibacteriota bacterium]NOG98304.1 hypothetical protein [Ignavibacteriota bacterium]